MFKTTIACFFSLVYLVNCSSSTNNEIYGDKSSLKSPEQIYIQAMQFFDSKQFDMAEEEFKKIVKLYPLSNEAIQGEIMLGFINYLKMDYDKAILKFNKIIQKYPSHKNLDYVYYMIAMCTYEQITNHELDGYYNEVSLENFNQVILRFPESEYAKDKNAKRIIPFTKDIPVKVFIAREPSQSTAVRFTKMYTVNQKNDRTKLTLLSNLCSKNCGIVYIFFSKKSGKKNLAITIRAIAAVSSHTAIAIPTTNP